MSGLLQTARTTGQQAQSQGSGLFMGTSNKVGNKKVVPINLDPVEKQRLRDDLEPVYATPVGPLPTRVDGTGKPNPNQNQNITGLMNMPDLPSVGPTSSSSAARPKIGIEADVADVDRPETQTGNYIDVHRPETEQYELRDNASVANQLNGLLAQDSPYIKQARQRAAEESAARGLRNSTLGVQSGEQAAISQALPIAQQDAQQNFQLQNNEQIQNYQMDQSLYNALLTGERDRVMQEYGLDATQYNAMLQQAQMQNQQRFELDRMSYGANLDEKRDNRQQQFALEQQKFSAQLQSVMNQEQHQMSLERMDGEQKNALERMNEEFVNSLETMGVQMEHQSRMAFSDSSTRIMQAAMEQIGYIYSNPEMTPEQQRNAVDTVMQNLRQQHNFLQGVYEPFPGLDFEPGEQPPSNTNPNNPATPNPPGGGGNNPAPPGGSRPSPAPSPPGGGGAAPSPKLDNQPVYTQPVYTNPDNQQVLAVR